MPEQEIVKEELDTEWLELIQSAKKIGLSIQEIRSFLMANENSNSA